MYHLFFGSSEAEPVQAGLLSAYYDWQLIDSKVVDIYSYEYFYNAWTLNRRLSKRKWNKFQCRLEIGVTKLGEHTRLRVNRRASEVTKEQQTSCA
jgi:hypothetical protein